MTRYWIFSSRSLDHIRRAYERLLWGFWDRDAGKKQRLNWRYFIRKYNQIKPFDVAIFQISSTQEIHALGIIKGTYYDDQTPVWDIEFSENRVLFPWRVSLAFMLFSEEPVARLSARISDYIDGYGLGEIERHEFEAVVSRFRERFGELRL